MESGKLKTACFLYRAGIVSKQKFFETIWYTSGKKISYYIYRLLLSEEEQREDLFQEVMLKIYTGLDSYDPCYGMSTWLYKIARNHCIDHLRKKQNDGDPVEAETLPSAEGNPEEIYLAGELTDEIEQAVKRLTEEERELAFLRFYEKMKFSEIGKITGGNINSLKTKIRRIKQKLRHELKGYRNE